MVECETPQWAVIDGDALCPSVAAASIVAKVARDAMMDDLAEIYPWYAFEQNKGYATPDHRAALAEVGRRTCTARCSRRFAPRCAASGPQK